MVIFWLYFAQDNLMAYGGIVLSGIDSWELLDVSVSLAGDVNGDGLDDLAIGYFSAGPGTDYFTNTYVVFGSSTGFSASIDLAGLNGANGFILNGIEAGDGVGFSVSAAGDINADGIDDLIVGAAWADPNGSSSGETYVVFGSASGFSTNIDLADLDGSNGFVLNGIVSGDLAGYSVSAAGDVNSDGIDDLIIGAPLADPNGSSSGETYVVFGSASGFSANIDLADLDGSNGFVLNGITAGDSAGSSVSSAGDINGDGIDDLLIGNDVRGPVGSRLGSAYVVFGSQGKFAATFELNELDGKNGFKLLGVDAGYSFYPVSGAGDINGDGVDDLVIGASGAGPNESSSSGETYLVFGSNTGFSASFDLADLDGSNGFVLNGIDAGDRSGCSVSLAGDINGDGLDDLLIGACQADPNGSRSGETYVVFGSASGFSASLDLADLDGANGFVLNGINAEDSSGFSVSSAGDVNGDGIDDLMIGAFSGDPYGIQSFNTYVVFGGRTLALLDAEDGSPDGTIELSNLGNVLPEPISFTSPISQSDVSDKNLAVHWTSYQHYGALSGHAGLDFPMPKGTAVRASADGDIIRAFETASSSALGNVVVIDHNSQNLHTLYAHLDAWGFVDANGNILNGATENASGQIVHNGKVVIGAKSIDDYLSVNFDADDTNNVSLTVKAGDIIGFVGKSGTDAVHLHFSILDLNSTDVGNLGKTDGDAFGVSEGANSVVGWKDVDLDGDGNNRTDKDYTANRLAQYTAVKNLSETLAELADQPNENVDWPYRWDEGFTTYASAADDGVTEEYDFAGIVDRPNDKDWFRFTVVEGERYEVTVTGTSLLGFKQLENPFFSIYTLDASNKKQTVLEGDPNRDDASGVFETATFEATESVDYYVVVSGGGDNWATIAGGYELAIRNVTDAETVLVNTSAETLTHDVNEDTRIVGTPEEHDGDTHQNFFNLHELVFQGVQFLRDKVSITWGSAILDIDTDNDGVSDTHVTLEGDFTGGEFVVEQGLSGTSIFFRTLLTGTDGADSITGTNGRDKILGQLSSDTISSGAGDDTVLGGNGRDRVFLGDGNDIYFDNGQIGDLGRDTVYGGEGNDTIEGGGGDDEFHGLDGKDLIYGRLGNDKILGGNGFDVLDGGDGNDTINGGNGRDKVFMGAGADLFRDNGQGGVNGQDTVFGNQGNDTIEGGGGADVFSGDLGNDVLRGRLGNDKLYGGDGFDTLDGGDGNDSVWGGNGRDKAFLGNGNDVFFDNGQGGTLGQDTVFGEAGFDTINGGAGNDVFHGQLGNDVIFGANGDDRLYGGDNADRLYGGNGNDTLWGGNGLDQIWGGVGLDTFYFTDGFGRDTVFGFEAADGEKISLAGVSGITDFTDLIANHLNNVGGTAQIVDGANTILLNGVAFGDVGVGLAYSADDFLF